MRVKPSEIAPTKRCHRCIYMLMALVMVVLSGCSSLIGGGSTAKPIEMTQRVGWGRPTNLTVSPQGLRVAELAWNAADEPAYRYRVERAETIEGPFRWVADVPGNRTTFVDGMPPATPLKDSATYYYQVCTILDKNGVMSEFTPPVLTTTAPAPLPPLALGSEATGSRAVTLSWQATTSPEVLLYRIERTPNDKPDQFASVGTSATTTFVDGGTPASTLKDSTTYLYRVIAINRVSSESEPSEITTVKTFPPPAIPKGLSGTSREVRCAPLTWQPNDEPDIVRYDIYQGRAKEGNFDKIDSVTGRINTNYTDGGSNPGNLEDDGTYFYRIRAINAVTAESADSETISVTTRPVPPAVTNLVAVSARPREVPLSWTVSADTTVTGYEIWRAPAADEDDWTMIAKINDRNITSHLDRGGQKNDTALGLLEDSTPYLYKLIAFNTANVRSSGSEPVKATTKIIPVPPAGLKTTAGTLARMIRIEWNPNPEKDVYAYVVEASRRADSGFKRIAQVQAGAPGATLITEESGLEPDTTRFYRIKALDREGIESLWSDTVEGRSKPLPDPPDNLAATYNNHMQTRITWDAPPQSDIVQYKVWAKRLLSWDLLSATDKREYILTAEESAKPPSIAVTSIDKDQLESSRSTTIKPEPQQP